MHVGYLLLRGSYLFTTTAEPHSSRVHVQQQKTTGILKGQGGLVCATSTISGLQSTARQGMRGNTHSELPHRERSAWDTKTTNVAKQNYGSTDHARVEQNTQLTRRATRLFCRVPRERHCYPRCTGLGNNPHYSSRSPPVCFVLFFCAL